MISRLLEKYNALETKQKILVPVTILIVLLLAYEVFAIFMPSTPSFTPPPRVNNAPPAFSRAPTNAVNPNPGAVQHRVIKKTKITQVPSSPPSPLMASALEQNSDLHKQYLKMLSQYQVLQLQELLARAHANLATAHVQEAEAQQRVEKLTNGRVRIGSSTTGSIGSYANAESSNEAATDFQVQFIGYQSGRWTGILSKDGKDYEIHNGSLLPDDVRVTSMNSRGIVVRREGYKRFIPIAPSLLN